MTVQPLLNNLKPFTHSVTCITYAVWLPHIFTVSLVEER